MNNIIVESQAGPDGMLHLDIPLGMERANQPVRVVIESPLPSMSQEQWRHWVKEMAGSITDPHFDRPPQLPLESREPLT